MESDESAGGAAQLAVPQRARGCAAVLCFLAMRSCKAPRCASLASGRCTVFHRTFNHSLAQLLRSPPPSLAHALQRFQRAARHARGRPASHEPMACAP